MKISLSVIIPAVLVCSAFFVFATTMAVRARITRPTTGMEGLVGETGVATTAISPDGKVLIHGEYWNVVSDEPIQAGEKIQVVAVKDLKLKVKKNV